MDKDPTEKDKFINRNEAIKNIVEACQIKTLRKSLKQFDLNRLTYCIFFIYTFLIPVDPKNINDLFFILLFLAAFQIRKEGIRICKNDFFFCLFLIGILFSFIGTSDSSRGLDQLRTLLKWIFFPFLVGQFDFSQQQKKLLFLPFWGAFLYYVVMVILELQTGHARYYYPRISGGYTISQFSIVISFYMIFFLLSACFSRQRILPRLLLFSSFTVGLIILILTGTRGVWISTAIALSITMALMNRKYFLGFLSLLLFLPIFLIILPQNPYSKRLTDALHARSLSERIEAQQEALKLFGTHPINGVGYGNFITAQNKTEYKLAEYYVHPHNMILKMLCETGIIGCLGYLLFKGGIFITLMKKMRHHLYALIVFGCFLSLEIYELATVIIRKQHAYPVLFLMFSILLQKNYHEKRIEAEPLDPLSTTP